LSLIILDSVGIFINGTMKILYRSPRPFWVNENLVPCGCATNYGSPSTTGLDIYLVCIVVYRGLINRRQEKWWKFLVWVFFLFPQAMAWISRFIQNEHSLHQLVFGYFVGYITQYIYFDLMEVDMNSEAQLKKLVNNTTLLFTVALSTLSWLFFNAVHYFFIHVSESPEMIALIEKYCSTAVTYYLFDNESYQKTAMAFLFIGAIVGILIEYRFVFGSNFEKFSKYNMGDNRWTETPAFKTAIRMVLMYLLKRLLIPLAKWGSKTHDSVAYLNLSKNIVANFWKGIFYFTLIKLVFRYLGLANNSTLEKEGGTEEDTRKPLLDDKDKDRENTNSNNKERDHHSREKVGDISNEN